MAARSHNVISAGEADEAEKRLVATLNRLKIAADDAINNSTDSNNKKFENELGTMAVQLKAKNAPNQADQFQAMHKAFAATPPAKKQSFVIEFAKRYAKMQVAHILTGTVAALVVGGVVIGGLVGTQYTGVEMTDGTQRIGYDVNNDGTLDATLDNSGMVPSLDSAVDGTSISENIVSFIGTMLGIN